MATSIHSIKHKFTHSLLWIVVVSLTVSLFVVPSMAATSFERVTITPQLLSAYFLNGDISVNLTYITPDGNLINVPADSWVITGAPDNTNAQTIWFYNDNPDNVYGGPDAEAFYFNLSLNFDFQFSYIADEEIGFSFLTDFMSLQVFDYDRSLLKFMRNSTVVASSNNQLRTSNYEVGRDFFGNRFSAFMNNVSDPYLVSLFYSNSTDVGNESNLLTGIKYNYIVDAGAQEWYGLPAIGIRSFDVMLFTHYDGPSEDTTTPDTTAPGGGTGGGTGGGSTDNSDVVDRLNRLNELMSDVSNSSQVTATHLNHLNYILENKSNKQDSVVGDLESGVNDFVGDLNEVNGFESVFVDGFDNFFGDYTDVNDVFDKFPDEELDDDLPNKLDPFFGHKVIGTLLGIVGICALLKMLMYGRW